MLGELTCSPCQRNAVGGPSSPCSPNTHLPSSVHWMEIRSDTRPTPPSNLDRASDSRRFYSLSLKIV